MGLESLDLLYMPSTDVEADLAFYRDVLGARIERRVELPPGPAATIRTPGGQRIGFYEQVRPGVEERWAGRDDF